MGLYCMQYMQKIEKRLKSNQTKDNKELVLFVEKKPAILLSVFRLY